MILDKDFESITDIAEWKVYLAQKAKDSNPLQIACLAPTPTETSFTNGNEYTAYKGGTEKVLENDGKEYGADNTLTQNYLIVKE